MEPVRNYADPAKTVFIPAGALLFGIEYRRLQNDRGLCIHVYRDRDGAREAVLRDEEVLRFDCFERAPHYHYAWSANDQYVPFDPAADGDPLQWTLERLHKRLPVMLIRAGAADLASTLDQREIEAALPKLAGWAEAMLVQERQQG